MNKKAQSTEMIFSNLTMLIMFLVAVTIGGLLAGLIYYDLGILETALKTVDFEIPIQDNTTAVALNMTHFQDILNVVVYPILGLRTSLPYLTYFMVFAFIIALGMSAYLGSKNPVFFVLHILFVLLISYFCLIISNAYSDLLTNSFINQLMINFTIYNKLMLYLAQVVFFTSLLFSVIAFVNLIKPQSSSTSTGLQYGGDY